MDLDITEDQLQELTEEISIFLGGGEIDVDLTKVEILVCLRYALLKFEKEIGLWQLQNQFINVYGLPAGLALTNQIATVNYALVRQITDWFASMQRVGGKIPWHKDYITLEAGRQIYYLDKESSKPYPSGTRRIHRVFWVAKPELFGSHFVGNADNVNGDDVLYNNGWNFTNSGLNYGSDRLGFLGYTMDTILMLQSVETRNKILFSEFFHNLSGDMLEISPMPGKSVAAMAPGTRVFYYYWDESELISGMPTVNQPGTDQTVYSSIEEMNPGSNGMGNLPPGQWNLIANPLQMKIEVVPWSYLSAWAKAVVKDIAFAKCKYIQGSKWRKIQRPYTSGEMDYPMEFDYSSLLTEADSEEQRAIENLRADMQLLNVSNLIKQQQETTDAAASIAAKGGFKWFIG